MKKYDLLLRKAEVFEKLALYGDRRAFLRAIAQGVPAPLSNDLRQGIDSAMKDLTMTRPDDPRSTALSNKLQGFYDGTSTDLGQLAQTLRDASNTIPGNLTTQVQRILDLANKVQQQATPQTTESEPAAAKPMVMPEAHIQSYAPIPKDIQEKLSKVNTVKGFGLPLTKLDGRIGPETKAALNEFKTRSTPPIPAATPNAEVFKAIERAYSEAYPQDFSWMEESAKKQNELAKGPPPPGLEPKK